MKKLALMVLAVASMALFFWAGRFTAPTPQFVLNDSAGDDELAAAFDDFIRAQRETLALYRNSSFYDDGQSRAEAYRGLLYDLVGSIRSALQSADYPRFMRVVDWSSKSGLDNPDNNYYMARISDDADYRILGNRGNTADLVFQLVIGKPGVRGAGTSTNVSVLYASDMHLDDSGDFEIIVSRDNPGPGVNWLPNDDGAESLLVRFTHSNWQIERDHPLYIERIGNEGSAPPPLTSAAAAAMLRDVAITLYDRTATWHGLVDKAWTMMPRNEISSVRPSQGGLVGQYSAFGTWQLADNEALLLSTGISAAEYQGMGLGNLWFVSLDYENRTSSLTPAQMQCSGDGRCYSVVAHTDPGVPNWLDTEGHQRGIIMLRWQGLTESMANELQPEARVIPIEQARQALPDDVPVFSAEQRVQQVRQRRQAVHHRFGG